MTTTFNQFTLYFDGGTNGPNLIAKLGGYGSWLIEFNGFSVRRDRVQFEYDLHGRVTNNVAEYLSLLHGLRWLESVESKDEFRVLIVGDSQLVLNQIAGTWKCKHERMRQHLAEATRRLSEFAHYSCLWEPRNKNVERFGH